MSILIHVFSTKFVSDVGGDNDDNNHSDISNDNDFDIDLVTVIVRMIVKMLMLMILILLLLGVVKDEIMIQELQGRKYGYGS